MIKSDKMSSNSRSNRLFAFFDTDFPIMEDSMTIRMDSKFIDKIDIRFSGPGIMDEAYDEMIQRRTVRLRRYVFTEDFEG